MSSTPAPEVTQVSDIIGNWGKWQTNVAVCCISAQLFSALNGMVSSFYAPPVNFNCISSDVNTSSLALNSDVIKKSFDNQCFINNESCTKFEYDTREFAYTAVSEWDLVCDQSWLSSLTQSVYMLGIVFSALIFGHCSDKYGRKPCVIIAVIIEIISGIVSSVSPSMTIFTISRFFVAFGCYGRNLTAFLLAIECVGTKYRAIMGMAVQLGWATGYIMLPMMAYYIDNFRHLLLANALPEIIWLVWLFWIPESPRWLLTHDRNEEAEAIIIHAVAMNNLKTNDVKEKFKFLKENIDREREAVTSSDSGQSFLDLWRSKVMIIYSIIFYFTWFTNAFVYYGISLNIGDLGGDLFWNFFWAGLVEFPSYFFCMFAFKIMGRRPLLAAMMFGAGISCLAIVPFYVMDNTKSSWIMVLAMFGKFCITSSFGIIYVYSAEVYPTVLRQIGVGSCSVAGRVGSIIAPFVKELSLYTNFGVSMAIFGGLSLATAFVSIKLPETKDKDIPDTIEDVEKLRLKR